MLHSHRTFPEARSGYELNPAQGFFSVVLPESTINLVTNPSFEKDTTHWTAYNAASIARVATQQRRGAWSLQVTPSAAPFDGTLFEYASVTAGQPYTFSFDFKGAGGASYRCYVADGVTPLSEIKKWKATGDWQRLSVTYPELTGGNRSLYILKNNDLSTQPFYVDGVQLEAKAYPTTYADGDQDGFIAGQQDYAWGGAAHASISYRTAQTRSGGKVVPLDDYGFHLLAFTGLGFPGIENVATPYALIDGAYFQRTRVPGRQFALVGALTGRNLGELYTQRAQLVAALRPDTVTPQGPLLLKYQMALGKSLVGEPLDLVCHYAGGLEGNTDNLYQERLALAFVCLGQPYALQEGEVAAALTANQQQATTSEGDTFRLLQDGTWQDALPQLSEPLLRSSRMHISDAGRIYVYDNDTRSVYTYDPALDEVTKFATVAGGAEKIRAVATGPDGAVYIGGDFTSLTYPTGLAASGIARVWINPEGNPVSSEPDNGVNLTGIYGVNAIALDKNGVLYVAGDFGDAGGVANTDHIARNSDPGGVGTWGSLGGATDDVIFALALDRDGTTLYVGGDFTTLAGTAANRVGQYAGSISALGTGMNGRVSALVVNRLNHLIAGGTFSTAGGNAAAGLASWRGAAWSAFPVEPSASAVSVLALGPDGITIFGGATNAIIDGVRQQTSIVQWNGARWLPFPIIGSPGDATLFVGGLAFYGDRQIFVASSAGNAAGTMYWPARTLVTNAGLASAYPKVRFTTVPQAVSGGVEVLYLENRTAGAKIYFNGLLVAPGEIVTLDLRPGHLQLYSNTRGVINQYILAGSNLKEWALKPGVNVIEFLSHVQDGSGGVVPEVNLLWREAHWDVAGALPGV